MQYSRAWATTRADDVVRALAASYRNVRITVDDPGFGMSVVSSGDHAVSLLQVDGNGAGRGHAEGDGFVSVVDVRAGDVAVRVDGTALDTRRLALLPPGRIDASWAGVHTVGAVRITRAAIDAHARAMIGPGAPAVTFSPGGAVSPTHELFWRSVERQARESVAAHRELLHNDLIWSATAQYLVSTLLTVFPNSTLGGATTTDGDRALPASLRRAIAYMEEHLAEPISVADIAAAARLSPRGVQDAFRRLRGRSPTQELRRLRLEAARADLLSGDRSDGVSVAAVAHRWGFGQVSRFAAAYRECFGENPSETLRR